MKSLVAIIGVLSVALAARAQTPTHPPIDPPPPPKASGLDKKLLRYVEDDAPVRGESENRDEALAYEYVVKYAKDVPIPSLREAARKDITFAQMLGPESAKYRGEVVHVEGRLKRIRDLGPTKALEADGVKNLYEAWIFSNLYREYSYCVLFSELPPGLTVSERLDVPVTFDGYFFKNYRFAAGDGPRRAPLLIGRTIDVVAAPSKPTLLDEMTRSLPSILTVLLVVIGLGGGLVLWMRAADRRTKARIEKARGNTSQLPTPDLFHEPRPMDGSPSVN